MCGRFSLSSDPARLAVELDAVDEASSPPPGLWPDRGPVSPRFNIAPTTTVPALVLDAPRERLDDPAGPRRILRAMRWGLVPSWARDPGRLPTLFNARVETAFEKPSFRTAVARRHCVVPMDGWYEWVPGEPATPGGRAGPKQPFHMSLPGDEGLLMAGLWEARRDPGDQTVTQLSCTILTTEALGPLRRVHDRMPLVVHPSVVSDWLDPSVIGDPRALVDGAGGDLGQWADSVEIRPVSRAVSNVRNEGPELVRPVDPSAGMLF
ncbi:MULTISPECIES: SOS response-associated peptidase [Dietzia]|uniref:Abasic site processing protein n=2 Tax=Dietzia TaxID=37914 RepID=A0ABN2III1_9ACTN|nr:MULTISPECIES: SOS response-associated peptidase [Dietzia]MBB1033377.1 SOS response-associated peptidase [Dietzia sp. CQ4]MBB1041663.1 SOS response-associated peptidase [Dietzia sp. Cai40]MBB1044534.1 SOS response-associated peptidase [Dietzia sp. DQ11-44]MBB1048155.1 SOS response-associated peptidase [Dietzia cercidiphylli]MBB1050156.1 SOS response-associated peptidase [Dietzia sp. CW19]